MIVHTIYGLDYKQEMRDTKELVLRWREKSEDEWVRKEKVVKDFRPYLYVESDSTLYIRGKDQMGRKVLSKNLKDQDGIGWAIEDQVSTRKLTTSGKRLDKVYFKSPG